MIEDLSKIAKQFKFENESEKKLLFKKRQNSLSFKMKVKKGKIYFQNFVGLERPKNKDRRMLSTNSHRNQGFT